VARSEQPRRRPRVRKSPPTVRELAESARSKAEAEKPRRARRVAAKSAAPIKKLRLGEKAPVRAVIKPLRVVKKYLAWLVPKYFVNSWRELRQVHWPNRRETWRLTLAVFVFAIIFGAMVAGVDKGLDALFKKLVLK
jgi:preprotein translocase SecE subunit